MFILLSIIVLIIIDDEWWMVLADWWLVIDDWWLIIPCPCFTLRAFLLMHLLLQRGLHTSNLLQAQCQSTRPRCRLEKIHGQVASRVRMRSFLNAQTLQIDGVVGFGYLFYWNPDLQRYDQTIWSAWCCMENTTWPETEGAKWKVPFFFLPWLDVGGKWRMSGLRAHSRNICMDDSDVNCTQSPYKEEVWLKGSNHNFYNISW